MRSKQSKDLSVVGAITTFKYFEEAKNAVCILLSFAVHGGKATEEGITEESAGWHGRKSQVVWTWDFPPCLSHGLVQVEFRGK